MQGDSVAARAVFGLWLLADVGNGAERANFDRSFLTTAGNLAVQTPESMLAMLPEKATAGDIALLTGSFLYLDLIDAFEAMLATISARGFTVALDTGWPSHGWTDAIRAQTTACLAHCDHVLLNEIESLSLSGEQTVEAAAGWLASHAKPGAIIVIKRGGDGASAWREGKATHVPAPAVAVIDLLKAFEDFRYPNDIGPGVYDIHSPNVPEVDWMVGLMAKAAARLPKERLWVNPDCGLKTRAWPETEAALIGMVQAARTLRQSA